MALALPFSLNLAGGMQAVVANVPPDTFNPFKGIGIGAIISMIVMYIASFSVGQEAVRAIMLLVMKSCRTRVNYFCNTELCICLYSNASRYHYVGAYQYEKIDGDIILSQGPKYALPHLAMATMPALIVGLLFSGIISATMSSADSDLLGAGSIFGNDIYKIYIKPNATNKDVMRVTQITMLIVGIFGMLIALFNTGSIIKLLLFSFTLRAAGLSSRMLWGTTGSMPRISAL